MKCQKVICPRLMTALSSIETSLLNGVLMGLNSTTHLFGPFCYNRDFKMHFVTIAVKKDRDLGEKIKGPP